MKGWRRTRKRWLALAVAMAAVLAFLPLVLTAKHFHFSHSAEAASAQSNSLSPVTLTLANATIDIAFASGALELSQDQVLQWVTAAAQAVTSYYGQFPVPHVRLLLTPFRGAGIRSGTTYGGRNPLIKVSLGEFTSGAMLQRDWVLTHEMVHLAFPSVPRAHHWIEEGLATYVEPLARHAAGQLSAEVVWRDLVEGLPKGLPGPGDKGLDHTPTWGRTYWGGALFCLLADIEIRQRTANRSGLRDALRAIVTAGGSMRVAWPLVRALEIGDQAIGVPVLTALYAQMKATPVEIDLADLWRRLGVKVQDGAVLFRDDAPLTSVRRAITPGESSPHTHDTSDLYAFDYGLASPVQLRAKTPSHQTGLVSFFHEHLGRVAHAGGVGVARIANLYCPPSSVFPQIISEGGGGTHHHNLEHGAKERACHHGED